MYDNYDNLMGRDVTQVIYVGQHLFVPHYLKPNIFVAPGGVEWLGDELMQRGGKVFSAFLCPRPYFTVPRPAHERDGWKEVLRQLQDGGPASVTEIAEDLSWSRGRVRHGMKRLAAMGVAEPWGTREGSSDPQRWAAKP